MEASNQEEFTFLIIDIEGSTRLWDHQPGVMRDTLRHHNTIIQEAIESNCGRVFKTVGNDFCTVFSDPYAISAAELTPQRDLLDESWEKE